MSTAETTIVETITKTYLQQTEAVSPLGWVFYVLIISGVIGIACFAIRYAAEGIKNTVPGWFRNQYDRWCRATSEDVSVAKAPNLNTKKYKQDHYAEINL
ncbi:hypothetical protein ENBRE01_0132 [Enteropsectra breve]|nr:hypothetical protein ENBRE01_0132 [Enteropsectra breve]